MLDQRQNNYFQIPPNKIQHNFKENQNNYNIMNQQNYQYQPMDIPREFGKNIQNFTFLTDNSDKENFMNNFNIAKGCQAKSKNIFTNENQKNPTFKNCQLFNKNTLYSTQNLPSGQNNYDNGCNFQFQFTNPTNEIAQVNPDSDVTMANTEEDNAIAPIQKEQQGNEYFPEIFYNFMKDEQLNQPKFGYMKAQIDINEKMRGILIDWLVEVHLKYKLNPETLFLTVNIVDRFLEKKIIMRNRLQLVGIAAMLIASKYEDIYPPELKDFEYISDKAFSKKEISAMENTILKDIDFNLGICSTFRFIEFYKIIMNLDEITFNLAWYFIELALIDYKMLIYKPSQLSTSACFVASKIVNSNNFDLTNCTGYREEDIKQCCIDLVNLIHNAQNSNLQSVYKKFSLSKYHSVSREIANF